MGEWRERMHALESIEEDPIQPQYLMQVIDRLADDDAILTSDSGTIATWAARHFTIREERAFYLSGNLATMAPGLPVHDRQPDRPPGPPVHRLRRRRRLRHADGRVRHGVPLRPADQGDRQQQRARSGQIMWEQLVLGYPEYGIRFGQRPTSRPGRRRAAAWASGSRRRAMLEGAIQEALAFPGPALVDVTVNPDEPPMPGKVEYEQAKGFVKAFLAGQPRKATIASTLFRDKITEMRA